MRSIKGFPMALCLYTHLRAGKTKSFANGAPLLQKVREFLRDRRGSGHTDSESLQALCLVELNNGEKKATQGLLWLTR